MKKNSNSPPILLGLFSSLKSVSNTFADAGWETHTVDNNPKLNPSICCNILELDKSQLPKSVDFIWASPACAKFSKEADPANWKKTTLKYRIYDYKPNTSSAYLALKLLQKTVEIIRLYPNALFVIENPIGRMHNFTEIKNLGHYRYAVNYADFGFNYSKETYLFSNMFLPFSTKKVHSAARGLINVHGSQLRSAVPHNLIKTIIYHIP